MVAYEINFEGHSDCSLSYSVKIHGDWNDENSELREKAVQEIGHITRSLVGQLQLTAVQEQIQNPSS